MSLCVPLSVAAAPRSCLAHFVFPGTAMLLSSFLLDSAHSLSWLMFYSYATLLSAPFFERAVTSET